MSFYSIAPFIQAYYPQYYSIESYPVNECVAIRKVNGEWGMLGNFARTSIIIEGVSFKSCEQLFQVMKFKDEVAVAVVYQANNPKYTAKHWEKTHRRNDWGQMIVDAMKFCLMMKYEQSNEFRQVLNFSKGNYIVEDQTAFPKKTADTWGVKLLADRFIGPNLLGRLLMELRDNGELEYQLPLDAFIFLEVIKKNANGQNG